MKNARKDIETQKRAQQIRHYLKTRKSDPLSSSWPGGPVLGGQAASREQRQAQNNTGTGLGLAIVKKTAASHNAMVKIGTDPDGMGTSVKVDFPDHSDHDGSNHIGPDKRDMDHRRGVFLQKTARSASDRNQIS